MDFSLTKLSTRFIMALLILPSAFAPLSALSQEYSPHAFEEFPTQLLWGDLHVHSSFSFDANSAGNLRLEPSEAYRYARGEAVTANSGMTAKLEQPLDFLVVADHSEYMGLLPAVRREDPEALADPGVRALHESMKNPAGAGFGTVATLGDRITDGVGPGLEYAGLRRNVWDAITRQADEANDPGRFTALIGFEWTSMPGGDNIHRVVVYRDDAEKAARRIPVSNFEGDKPEDLWAFMEAYESELGGRILAIPHNANMSNGRMFALTQSDGSPIDAAYAKRRARLEPLAEVTQYKGDGEAHPKLSPDDAFADFETWDFGNLHATKLYPKEDWMLEFEYARSALKLGLGVEADVGTNPFQFGMIGSTDSHTSLAAGAEDDFWGKISVIEPGPRTWVANNAPISPDAKPPSPWDFAASGYTGVWAQENTRESIFDALARREVYATTGSRITLRFFGGFDFDELDADRPNLARVGYAKGVPMGSELDGEQAGAAEEAPSFLIAAQKDPLGANLDRLQVVKGWRDADGALQEKVYDVAISEGRRSLFGGVRDIVSTVDVATATYTNDVGTAELRAVFRDPDFDPAERAFYYARVIEIPTPRWNVYDTVRLGANLPETLPTEVQDRAYSSPIWYTP